MFGRSWYLYCYLLLLLLAAFFLVWSFLVVSMCLYTMSHRVTELHESFFSLLLPGPFFQTGWPWQIVYMLRFFGLSLRGTYAFIGNSMASGVWGRFDEAQKAHEALFLVFLWKICMAWLEFWSFFLFFSFLFNVFRATSTLMQILILFLLYTYRYTRHIWRPSMLGSDVCYGILLAFSFDLLSCILLGENRLGGLMFVFYRCVCYYHGLAICVSFIWLLRQWTGFFPHCFLVNQFICWK